MVRHVVAQWCEISASVLLSDSLSVQILNLFITVSFSSLERNLNLKLSNCQILTFFVDEISNLSYISFVEELFEHLAMQNL